MTTDLIKPETLEQYKELDLWMASLKDTSLSDWADAMRWYCREDLFFLVSRVLSCSKIRHSETGLPVMEHKYYLSLARAVEKMEQLGVGLIADSRGMGKSTVANFGANIRRILKYPEASGFICSEYKVAGKKHYLVVYNELLTNNLLKELFDDVLYMDPRAETGQTSEPINFTQESLTVKRKGNRKEPTLSVSSFFDGGDVGGHYEFGTFDDCETGKMVRGGPERIKAAKTKYSEHVRLLKPIHVPMTINIICNTFWHKDGLVYHRYLELKDEDPRMVRVVSGEDLDRPGDGPLGGSPNYPYTLTELEKTWRDTLDKKEYALQVANDFVAGEIRRLNPDFLLLYEESPKKRARGRYGYITIDPSRGGDPGCALTWATDWAGKYSLVDGWVRKIDCATTAFDEALISLVSRSMNLLGRLIEVRVEEIGQSTWGVRVQEILRSAGFKSLPVRACKQIYVNRQGEWDNGKLQKHFERFAAPLGRGEICLPKPHRDGGPGLMSLDEGGRPMDLSSYFMDWELGEWPMGRSDTMLDATVLLWERETGDINKVLFPSEKPQDEDLYGIQYKKNSRRGGTWMSA